MQRITSTRGVLSALLGLVLVAMLAGCSPEASYRVRFVSDPPGALMAVVRPSGADRAIPGATKLAFPDSATVYTVEAKPAGALEENYKATRVEIRRGDVHFLPVIDGVRTYLVRMREKDYVELWTYEAVYTPARGIAALRTRSRAYDTVLEGEGRVVEPVMAVRDCDGIRGLALSPAGDQIAYGAFSVRPELAAESEAPSARGKGAAPASAARIRLDDIASGQIRGYLLQGTARQAITPGRNVDLDPAFSADGRWLLYSSNHDRYSLQDIYRQGAGGRTAVAVLTQDLGSRSAFWPVESVGGLVVFSQIGSEAASLSDAEICTRGGAAGYTAVVHNGVHPAVSPDGKRIAYIKRGDLYVCDADGAQESRLTSDAEEIREAYRASLSAPEDQERFDRFERYWLFLAHSYPAWTPDGRWIVFSTVKHRDAEGRPNEDLAAITAEGTREVRITVNPSSDRHPMISADGKWIYFLSNRGKQWAVWRMEMVPDLVRR